MNASSYCLSFQCDEPSFLTYLIAFDRFMCNAKFKMAPFIFCKVLCCSAHHRRVNLAEDNVPTILMSSFRFNVFDSAISGYVPQKPGLIFTLFAAMRWKYSGLSSSLIIGLPSWPGGTWKYRRPMRMLEVRSSGGICSIYCIQFATSLVHAISDIATFTLISSFGLSTISEPVNKMSFTQGLSAKGKKGLKAFFNALRSLMAVLLSIYF